MPQLLQHLWAQLSLHNSPVRGSEIRQRWRGTPWRRLMGVGTDGASSQCGARRKTQQTEEGPGDEKWGSQNQHLLTRELKTDRSLW